MTMEWSREKTMKLIELLQGNASLWNPSLCQTRRDKQKRRTELKNIADILEVYVADVTRKIQHLRTQYNREWMREIRANTDNPEDPYVSSWYAFEYLHFLKHSSKPYRVLETDDNAEAVMEQNSHSDNLNDSKHQVPPPAKMARIEHNSVKSEEPPCPKDDLSLFGEYIANELRSVKGEKNLLVAKKKILDVIFEVKLENTCEERTENVEYTNTNSVNDKVFTTPTITTAQIEPLSSHTVHSTAISEIIINSACHYSNFKVDAQ